MRWANKIMSNNQDQSQSKLSNRSLSKFKKVNLQKSEAEISSNEHLEKSVLKLASIQKIKPTNLNLSFISSYVAPSQPVSQRSSRQQLTQNHGFETEKSKQAIQNSKSSKSVQIQYPKLFDFGSQFKDGFKQGYGIFGKEVNQTPKHQQQIKNSNLQMQNPQNLRHEQKLKRVLIKIQEAMAQFREVSQSIKKNITETISSGFFQLQNQLLTCTKLFEASLENGIQQMIKMIGKERRTSRFKTENLVNTNQIVPPSPSNDSFYKIGNFQHEEVEIETQKQTLTSRPNKFKNQFKQIIDDSNNQNFLTKNQIESSNHQKSGKKLIRKQTNPVNRVNSLVRNDTSVINDDRMSNANDKSMSSIRYSRAKDRSASKSVQKLHEKLVLIKNIFKGAPSDSGSVKNEEVKILIQNNS